MSIPTSGKFLPKILNVIGTRPETIKMAPVMQALQDDPRFTTKTVFTGQHKDMVAPLLDWFGLEVDYTLDVMRHRQPLAELSGKLLNGLHEVMEQEHPDFVLVQGDTTSAFTAALAAYYGYDYALRHDGSTRREIKIVHVEAGLRTGDLFSPFPEEANRKLIGQLAGIHFAPTQTAADALEAEGITKNVFVTGNTVIDALMHTAGRVQTLPLPIDIKENSRIILITAHRRENYGDGLIHMCEAIRELAKKFPQDDFVYPVHPNKNVREVVEAHLKDYGNIHLLEPLDYPEFVALMKRSHLVLTDSGGLQEEAPSLGKPVLVMRDTTERPDAITAGTAKMVGTETNKIIDAVSNLLNNDVAYHYMASAVNPYGDGRATERMLNILAGEDPAVNRFRYAA